jgi:hypothetical protein
MITLTLVRLISDFTKADGIDLVDTDELYALMSQINLTIANDLITTLTNLDNYKSFYQLLTNYSPDSLHSLFQRALF